MRPGAAGRTPRLRRALHRATRLLQELLAAHGDGSFGRRLSALAKLDLLVLDDLAIAPIAAQERQDLLELLDHRAGSRSTLITSQLRTSAWCQWLGEPTIVDAVMDRLLHGSHTLALEGDALRRALPSRSWPVERPQRVDCCRPDPRNHRAVLGNGLAGTDHCPQG